MKKEIFFDRYYEQGYIGLRCLNPKIQLIYFNPKKEVRKHYDLVIIFSFDEKFIKSYVMDYKKSETYKLPKVKFVSKEKIYSQLMKEYKKMS